MLQRLLWVGATKFDCVYDTKPPIKMPEKCAHSDCKKKLALTSITCKCEKTFCPNHRYPTDHACSFDFHNSAKQVLLKTMSTPIVAAKLEMI